MPDIEHALVIAAPGDRIRQLVSSGEGFAQWWAEDVTTGTEGVELGFFDRSTVYRLVPRPESDGVTWTCETGAEWTGTSLVFRMRPQGAQTRLEFTHEGWANRTDYFVSCNTLWGHLMFRIKGVAEGAPAHPYFTRSGTADGAPGGY
jgi:hypothetical protein